MRLKTHLEALRAGGTWYAAVDCKKREVIIVGKFNASGDDEKTVMKYAKNWQEKYGNRVRVLYLQGKGWK